jgi:hypothetical protein
MTMDVQAAIDLLIHSNEEATQMIDAQIAELEAKLLRLKRARSVLAKACGEHRAAKRTASPRSKPADDGKLAYWDELEQKIYDAVNNCSVKLTCKELGEILNLNYTSIGRCINKSQRLDKEGSYIVVIA